MERFELSPKQVDTKALLRQKATQGGLKEYARNGIYCLNGEPVIYYGNVPFKTEMLRYAIRKIKYRPEKRSNPGGSVGQRRRETTAGSSRIFGFRPRIPYQANYCAVCATAVSDKFSHAMLCNYAEEVSKLYSEMAPTVAMAQAEAVAKNVRPEWMLPGGLFTAGIANDSNPLNYHFDKGNFEGGFSVMLVFRKWSTGGWLNIPELGGSWFLDDDTFFMFDGQRFLHGVTPISNQNQHGYRCSVVYYAQKAMSKCGSLDEEIARARKAKRLVEKRRVTSAETASS